MFSSSGFFADIDCPFSKRGLCERPHCLYRHVTKTPDVLDTCCISSLTDSAGGVQNGAAESRQTKDVCLNELERLNKEIETVRHEVEQEKRRLSYYRIGQTGRRGSKNTLISTAERENKNLDKKSNGLPISTGTTKMYSQVGKYVVDNSKPRTDLEYDPLSNFSAGLHPGAQPKVKNGHGLKKARYTEPDHTKLIECKGSWTPRSPSPEPQDDLIEDGVLIIDIPSSPDANGGKEQKHLDSGANKSLEDRKLNNFEATLAVACTSQFEKPIASKGCSLSTVEYAEQKIEPTIYFENKIIEKSVNQSVEMEAKKIAESGTITLPPEPLMKRHENSYVTLCQYESPCGADATKLQQSSNFLLNNSIFYDAPLGNSDLQCRQQELPAKKSTAGRLVQGVAADDKALPASCLEKAEPGSSCRQTLAAVKHSALDCAQLSDSRSAEIIIKSSSDEDNDDNELNYSDLDLSDSDPMEECFRIFMEDSNKDKASELPQTSREVLTMEVERPEVKVETQEVAGKKRVAHEQVAERRPQPQVLVPLRTGGVLGFTSQPSVTSKMQQVQQRACALTASVKAAQTFVSTANQRPDMQRATPCVQMSKNLQPAPVQNAYVNCLPAGTAVIEVGNNLHLILSKGTFPVTSSSSGVTTVLTPIGQVQTNADGLVKENYFLPVVTAAQRCRTAATVLIPAPARKPAPTLAIPSAHSASVVPSNTPAGHTSVKPISVKRKLKQQSETPKEKVPHNIRQRYVNMFTEEFLKTTANVNEAFEKALAEERTVYNRSVNKLKYLSVAVNALKRLKNQTAVAAKGDDECNNQRLRGSIPLNLKKCNGTGDEALYESLKAYILKEEKLIESNYPVQHPEKVGCAVLYTDNKRASTDVHKRICCRCGATYSVSQTGKHTRKEECNYHYGKGVTKKVPGGVETRYSCCEGVMGAPGCQVFKLHVHDSLSLDGFVQTVPGQPSSASCPGVYSLDCEMCYTIQGLELSRVTLVNSSLQVIYDTFVRPDNEVIDYNTRFSGIGEEDVKGHHTSLSEVQETLLSFISADTILIGHSLEMDLCALKLLHGTVVDTSVVFPHRLGPPHKLTLNNLTADYLRRIIQESVCGHDTAEDATACMELMLWKIKEDGKMRNGGSKT